MPYKFKHHNCFVCGKSQAEQFMKRVNYIIDDRSRVIHGWKCKYCDGM